MHRIAVIGNCSALGIAEATQRLLPATEVRHFDIAALLDQDRSELESTLDGFDLHFSFSELPKYEKVAAGVERIGRSVEWPCVVFAGYHPDIVYFAVDGKPATSCLGAYNSRIVAIAYACRITVADTADLFNALTYGRFGYFDLYAPYRNQFLNEARRCGVPLDEEFAEWERRGPFMHTLNHPKLFVLNDIARKLVNIAGIEAADVQLPQEPDYMASGIGWPVYPELGARFDITGTLEFRPAADVGDRILTLEEFIDGCFRKYRDDGFTPEHFEELGFADIYRSKLGRVKQAA